MFYFLCMFLPLVFSQCTSYTDKTQCYMNTNCFWHSHVNQCEDLNNWHAHSSTSPPVHPCTEGYAGFNQCYGVPNQNCFWNQNTLSCDDISHYSDGASGGFNNGGGINPNNNNPYSPFNNGGSTNGGGTNTNKPYNPYNPYNNGGATGSGSNAGGAEGEGGAENEECMMCDCKTTETLCILADFGETQCYFDMGTCMEAEECEDLPDANRCNGRTLGGIGCSWDGAECAEAAVLQSAATGEKNPSDDTTTETQSPNDIIQYFMDYAIYIVPSGCLLLVGLTYCWYTKSRRGFQESEELIIPYSQDNIYSLHLDTIVA